MSFWRKVIGSLGDRRPSNAEVSRDASRWAFVDVEVGLKDKRIHDIGRFYHSIAAGKVNA